MRPEGNARSGIYPHAEIVSFANEGRMREDEKRCARALFVVDDQETIQFGEAYPDAINPGVGDLLSALEEISAE